MKKKILYFALLAVELFFGVLLMSSLWMSMLYVPIAIAAVAVVAVLSWQLVLLGKTTDPADKQGILCKIALAMLIPVAVFIATYAVIAVGFVIAFV